MHPKMGSPISDFKVDHPWGQLQTNWKIACGVLFLTFPEPNSYISNVNLIEAGYLDIIHFLYIIFEEIQFHLN